MRRALGIDEASFGASHPNVAIQINNLAGLLHATNRLDEAEPLLRRALAIDEASYGTSHPNVALRQLCIGDLLQAKGNLVEAEPYIRTAVQTFLSFTRDTGHQHAHLMGALKNYGGLLMAMGDTQEQAREKIRAVMAPFGMSI